MTCIALLRYRDSEALSQCSLEPLNDLRQRPVHIRSKGPRSNFAFTERLNLATDGLVPCAVVAVQFRVDLEDRSENEKYEKKLEGQEPF